MKSIVIAAGGLSIPKSTTVLDFLSIGYDYFIGINDQTIRKPFDFVVIPMDFDFTKMQVGEWASIVYTKGFAEINLHKPSVSENWNQLFDLKQIIRIDIFLAFIEEVGKLGFYKLKGEMFCGQDPHYASALSRLLWHVLKHHDESKFEEILTFTREKLLELKSSPW